MIHQWRICFDYNDFNRDGQLDRTDLEKLKASVISFIPKSERSRVSELQDKFWKQLLQADDLDIVMSESKFVGMNARMFLVDKMALYTITGGKLP